MSLSNLNGMADRRARVTDVHRIAAQMPHTTRIEGPKGNAVYQVGGKSFVFFRTPQPDAVDPETGAKYPDVLMLWVEEERDKLALLQDPRRLFFTTDRFDGHPSVLLRTSRIGEIGVTELTELIADAWLSRASHRRAQAWLASQEPSGGCQ
ncbi:hypothetical protein MMUR_03630 [Mycolicibacterium murale]|uniref:Uncharacterized protein n=2 Tax=Mycolicibacterium murale TaxID=182220 RepID=A0A7I9WG15_9MYCO|nr:hypothetical protein MMUR_03630 [Mycolicibacterium murale]